MGSKKKSFCKRGHPLIEDNIVYNDDIYPGTARQCRICKNEKNKNWLRKYRARLKQEKLK
jgi:hypothetical protein